MVVLYIQTVGTKLLYFCTTEQDIGQSIAYQRLCSSQLQLAATKTLHTLLCDESVVELLTYQPPSLETVVWGERL